MKLLTQLMLFTPLCLASFGLTAATKAQSETDIVPMTRHVAPEYPSPALRKGVVGHVLVEYTVNEKGRAEDVKVVESVPEGVFDRAARLAIKRSRFEKQAADGQSRRFVFDIDQEALADIARR